MFKKRCWLIILVLLVILTGTACQQSSQTEIKREVDDNLRWETYANDYYKIKHPAKWKQADLNSEVGFAPEGSELLGFDVKVKADEDISSEEEFYNYINQEVRGLSEGIEFKAAEKITIQGQPAYRLEVSSSRANVKLALVSIYKNGAVFNLKYKGRTEEYDQNLAVAKEMLDSFQLSEFEAVAKENKQKDPVEGRKLTAQEAGKDARYLWNKLEQVHPNLYYHRSKKEAVEHFNQIKTKLKSQDKWSKRELYNLLAPFAASFKDGHTSLFAGRPFRNHVQNGGKVFPLAVEVEKQEVIVRGNFSNEQIPKGAVLTSINDTSVVKLLAEMKEKVSYEREPFGLAVLERRFVRQIWANFGPTDKFTVQYKTDAGAKEQVTLEGITGEDYKRQLSFFSSQDETDFSLAYPQSGTALLTVNTFSSGKKQEFKRKIKNYFKEIKQKEINNLIIDIRNNGGGTTRLVRYLYEFITDKPYCTFSKVKKKLSTYALKQRSGRLSRVAVLKSGKDKIQAQEASLTQPGENKYRFNGEVYVLIGSYTFSSAADFAAIIKDYETGTLVGQETGGLATCYGDQISGQLPNSGLDFGVSYKKFIRPAGFSNGRGVIPDVKVDVDAGKIVQGKDQVLQKTLELIKQN